MKKFLLVCTPVVASVVTTLITFPAHAAIIWSQTTGNIEKQEVPFWEGTDAYQIPESSNILAFDENQNILLPEDRDILIQEPNDWDNAGSILLSDFSQWGNSALAPDLPLLPKNIKVNSHFLYFRNPTGNYTNAQATVTFDGPIIGVMGDPRLYVPTTDIFYDSFNITNPEGFKFSSLEGLSWPIANQRDTITITGDNSNVLGVSFFNQAGMDPLRVITLEVAPEPLTLMGVGTAIGMGTWFKKKLSAQQKQKKTSDKV